MGKLLGGSFFVCVSVVCTSEWCWVWLADQTTKDFMYHSMIANLCCSSIYAQSCRAVVPSPHMERPHFVWLWSDPELCSLQQAGLIGENPLAALPVQQGAHLLGDLPQGLPSACCRHTVAPCTLHVFALLLTAAASLPVIFLYVRMICYSH